MPSMSAIVGTLIAAMVAIVIGLAFLPTVFQSTTTVTGNTTYADNSHLASTLNLVYLLPLVFVIIIVVAAVGFILYERA